jgi:hypothetical protein
MKLPADSIIVPEKLTQYLLVARKRNDKSAWLASAGFTVDNWRLLELEMRKSLLTLDAKETEQTMYGQMYELTGDITGPNGRTLSVCSVWMHEYAVQRVKFITLYPNKKWR